MGTTHGHGPYELGETVGTAKREGEPRERHSEQHGARGHEANKLSLVAPQREETKGKASKSGRKPNDRDIDFPALPRLNDPTGFSLHRMRTSEVSAWPRSKLISGPGLRYKDLDARMLIPDRSRK